MCVKNSDFLQNRKNPTDKKVVNIIGKIKFIKSVMPFF